MSRAQENKLVRLIELLEEASVILKRASHTAEELSQQFRVALNDNWQVEGKKDGSPTV